MHSFSNIDVYINKGRPVKIWFHELSAKYLSWIFSYWKKVLSTTCKTLQTSLCHKCSFGYDALINWSIDNAEIRLVVLNTNLNTASKIAGKCNKRSWISPTSSLCSPPLDIFFLALSASFFSHPLTHTLTFRWFLYWKFYASSTDFKTNLVSTRTGTSLLPMKWTPLSLNWLVTRFNPRSIYQLHYLFYLFILIILLFCFCFFLKNLLSIVIVIIYFG